MTNKLRVILASLTLLVSTQAQAVSTTTSSFYVDWTGALYGNAEAQAHAWLTVFTGEGSKFTGSADDAWLAPINDVVDFSITISGAGSGNGTFGLSDFDFFIWSTEATTEWPLDLSRELVGQATTGGEWGGDTSFEALTGEFNLFANLVLNPFAPTSDGGAFRLVTNGGAGDVLNLVSFRPVPIPAAFWLFGPALLGLTGMGYKRQVKAVLPPPQQQEI